MPTDCAVKRKSELIWVLLTQSDIEIAFWFYIDLRSLLEKFNEILYKYWPRLTLKGPKRSFVVAVFLIVLSVEKWNKKCSRRNLFQIEQIKRQNHCFMFFLPHLMTICGHLSLIKVLHSLFMVNQIWPFKVFYGKI